MDLPFTGNSQTPPPRRPTLAVSFSAPAGASGGGGLMDSVSSVAAAVGIDLSGPTVDPWQRSVSVIVCDSFLAPRVDVAKILLASDSQAPGFNLDDTGTIQLGYAEDQNHTVFSGSINAVQTGLQRQAVLTIVNGAQRLSQLRTNQSFEQQKAGDVVKTLAQLAEVDTGTVESGADLPFYVVDDSRNLYQHIAILAEKSGLLAYIDGDGKLQFKAIASTAPDQIFHYGVDILHLTLTRRTPPLDAVTVIGAGTAGSEGSDTWNWLVKDPQSVSATAGDGSATRLIVDPSLRSSDAVQQAAAGKLFLAKQQALKLKLTVIGAAQIRAGSRIEIADAPATELNGTAIIESARHHYSKHKGFICELVALQESADNSMDSLLSGALGALGGLL